MKKLQSNISKFFADVKDKKTEAAVYAVANEVLNIAQTYTPVDTSLLINSKFGPLIVSSKDGVKATVGFNAEYAKFVPVVLKPTAAFTPSLLLTINGPNLEFIKRDVSTGDLIAFAGLDAKSLVEHGDAIYEEVRDVDFFNSTPFSQKIMDWRIAT